MTATVVTAPTPLLRPTYKAAGFADVLRSEWTKVRSVPSTLWTLLVAAVLGVGLSALFSGLAAHSYKIGSHGTRTNWDPTAVST